MKVLEKTGKEEDMRARKLRRNKEGEKRKCGRKKRANRRKKKNVLKEGRAAINK
jgi:hypothetical protein